MWSKSRVTKRCTGREEVGKMTHQLTVTKNYKNTQSEFDSNLGSCDVSVAPRAVRLSTSPGTQLLLLLKGNSDVPLSFHFLNYVCKPSKNCNPARLRVISNTYTLVRAAEGGQRNEVRSRSNLDLAPSSELRYLGRSASR